MKLLGEGKGQGMNRSLWAGAHVTALLVKPGDKQYKISSAFAWELCNTFRLVRSSQGQTRAITKLYSSGVF